MLKKFKHQKLSLDYMDTGSDGPVLVFQHGLTGYHQQIQNTFQDKNFRIITLDCRGHGESDLGEADDLSIAVYAEDVVALLNYLRIKKASFAGISMGAAVVSCIAGKHPNMISSLTLIRPAWFDKAIPHNLIIFSIISDLIEKFGQDKGMSMLIASEAFRSISDISSDNANSLINLFKQPKERAITVLRAIISSDPCYDAALIKASKIPVKVVGTALDIIHPLDKSKLVADSLGLKGFIEVYPKSLDPQRHFAELREIIKSNIFPE